MASDMNNDSQNKEELEKVKLTKEISKIEQDTEKIKYEIELLKQPLLDKFKQQSLNIMLVSAIGTVLTVALSVYTTSKLYDVKAKEIEIKLKEQSEQINNIRKLRPKLEEMKKVSEDDNPQIRYNIANEALKIIDTILLEAR